MKLSLSEPGLQLIQSFEGYRSESYDDSTGVWTIGYGTIRYPSGARVCQHQECTHEKALEWLKYDVRKAIDTINNLAWNKSLNQSQFDALVSFQYNTGHLAGSTLYRKARANPEDESIYNYDKEKPIDSCEFLRWCRAGGKVMNGLIKRRIAEADLYVSLF